MPVIHKRAQLELLHLYHKNGWVSADSVIVTDILTVCYVCTVQLDNTQRV